MGDHPTSGGRRSSRDPAFPIRRPLIWLVPAAIASRHGVAWSREAVYRLAQTNPQLLFCAQFSEIIGTALSTKSTEDTVMATTW
jgi:hypothetical protein